MTSRHPTLTRVALAAGLASSLLYVAMNVLAPMQWESYSSASQTVSELSAVGAPTRPLWVSLAVVYGLLVAAFGWAVWTQGRCNARLRVLGGLILANALFGLVWPPMHQREVLAAGGATLTDSLHIAWTIATNVLFLLQIGFAAASFGTRFRYYSVATVLVLLFFGALAGMEGAKLQANLATPLIGIWERIAIGVFMLWFAVLSTMLLQGARPRIGRRRALAS